MCRLQGSPYVAQDQTTFDLTVTLDNRFRPIAAKVAVFLGGLTLGAGTHAVQSYSTAVSQSYAEAALYEMHTLQGDAAVGCEVQNASLSSSIDSLTLRLSVHGLQERLVLDSIVTAHGGIDYHQESVGPSEVGIRIAGLVSPGDWVALWTNTAGWPGDANLECYVASTEAQDALRVPRPILWKTLAGLSNGWLTFFTFLPSLLAIGLAVYLWRASRPHRIKFSVDPP